MSENDDESLRRHIADQCRRLEQLGLNSGASGNLSVRIAAPDGAAMLITPSAVPGAAMTPGSIALMPLEPEDGAWLGPMRPSSEWRMHRDIYRARPDVGAIVHTHSAYATALAMLHRPIPAAHYMIGAFGGPLIHCTDYAPFGTQELSDLAVAGLEDMQAALLGNHGAIACGAALEDAVWRAIELENLARSYAIALSIGAPVVLPDAEVTRIADRFATRRAGG